MYTEMIAKNFYYIPLVFDLFTTTLSKNMKNDSSSSVGTHRKSRDF